MTIQPQRHIVRLASAIAALLMVLAPTAGTAQTATDTGTVSVEITPPDSVPGQPHVGTLSGTIMWLPDPAQGQQQLHGLLAVQDHRASADGWTIRLTDESPQPAHLVGVTVGAPGFGLPDWVNDGLFGWDVAVGASLAESPQAVTAPPRHGYGLTIHQVTFELDPAGLGLPGGRFTLTMMLPAAP